MTTTYAAAAEDVRDALERIAAHIHCTPVLTCAAIDRAAGRSLFFKCENLQKTGSFKFRGAANAVLRLSDEAAAAGVATHSSGNFAQALALAGAIRGIDVHVVMPENSARIKRAATESYGARVHSCAPTLEAREETTHRVVEETGATLIHPFNDPDIIAGQGTCAAELLAQRPDLDAVIAPIGGGGLMSGTCIAARGISPSIQLLAGEPCGADDAARSLEAGTFIAQTNPHTIADGLRTSMGDLTWQIVRDHVDRVVTVTDEQIVDAMRLLWERMKLVIEPSAAVALAALLDESFRSTDGPGHVGVILSGGNVDLDRLPWSAGGA